MSKKVFAPTVVYCNSCKWNSAVVGTLIRKEDDVMNFASAMHKANPLVCPKPDIVILFCYAMVSNETFNRVFNPKPDTNTNGNDASSLIVKGNG